MNALGFQVSRFVIVGVINTLLDLFLFNIFRRFKRISATVASYISSSIAMINSYLLNRYWTFGGSSNGSGFEFVKFFLSTVIGIYVIHNGIVWILTNKFLWPGNFVLKLCRLFKSLKFLSDSFITDNFAKFCAIFFSLLWNFMLYKFWVFSS